VTSAESRDADLPPAEQALPRLPGRSSAGAGNGAELLSTEEAIKLLAINPHSRPYRIVAPAESLQGRDYAPLVRICVSESGSVSSARITKPTHPLLDRRIEETLSRWRYRPHVKQGRATPFCHSLIYRVE
jgi:TonB family protein